MHDSLQQQVEPLIHSDRSPQQRPKTTLEIYSLIAQRYNRCLIHSDCQLRKKKPLPLIALLKATPRAVIQFSRAAMAY